MPIHSSNKATKPAVVLAVLATGFSMLAFIMTLQHASAVKERQAHYAWSDQWAQAGMLYARERSETRALLYVTEAADHTALHRLHHIRKQADEAFLNAKNAELDTLTNRESVYAALAQYRKQTDAELRKHIAQRDAYHTEKSNDIFADIIATTADMRYAAIAGSENTAAVTAFHMEDAALAMRMLHDDIQYASAQAPGGVPNTQITRLYTQADKISEHFRRASYTALSAGAVARHAVKNAHVAYETIFRSMMDARIERPLPDNTNGEALIRAVTTKINHIRALRDNAGLFGAYAAWASAVFALYAMLAITASYAMYRALNAQAQQALYTPSITELIEHLDDMSADMCARVLRQAGESFSLPVDESAPETDQIHPASYAALRHSFM